MFEHGIEKKMRRKKKYWCFHYLLYPAREYTKHILKVYWTKRCSNQVFVVKYLILGRFFFFFWCGREYFFLEEECILNMSGWSTAVSFPSNIHIDKWVMSKWNGFIKDVYVARFNTSVNLKRLIEISNRDFNYIFIFYLTCISFLRQLWKKK